MKIKFKKFKKVESVPKDVPKSHNDDTSTCPPLEMSATNASSSSSQLVTYAQDIDYTRMEGFKQFKVW